MELTLKRIALRSEYTIGKLYVDGEYVCDTIEDTVRDLDKDGKFANGEVKIHGKTAIPYGRYEVTMKVRSPKYSNFAKYSWAKKYDGYLPRLLNVPHFEGILIHCLHPDMQILTSNGWQNLESIINNKPSHCWSYNTKKDLMEFIPIDDIIIEQYDGDLYCCERKSGAYNNTSFRVTDKHRMFCEYKSSFDVKRGFVEAKDLPINATFIAQSNTYITNPVDDRTFALYKLCMHIVADGYIRWYKIANGEDRATISFHYRKERKIQRVIDILNECELRYSRSVNNDKSTTIRILHPDSEKIAEIIDKNHKGKDGKCIPMSFTKLPKEQMVKLIEEYNFADGRYECRNDEYVYNITSTNIDVLNILQIMAFLSGFSSSMAIERYESVNNNWKNGLALTIYKQRGTRTPSNSSYYKCHYSGKVFCISNANHTIVARNSQCDVPFILGNCGNTATDTEGCLCVGENKVVGKVINSVNTFRKLMDEYLVPAKKRNEQIYIEIV